MKFIIDKMIGASNIKIPNENGTKEYNITISNNKEHEEFFTTLSNGINLPSSLIQSVTFDFAKKSGEVVPVTINITLIQGASLYGTGYFTNATYKNVVFKKGLTNDNKNAQIQILGIRLKNVNKPEKVAQQPVHKQEDKKPDKVKASGKVSKTEPVTKVSAKTPVKETPKVTTSKSVGSNSAEKSSTKSEQKINEKSTSKTVDKTQTKQAVETHAKK